MKKIKKHLVLITINIILFSVLVFPYLVSASGLVTCNGPLGPFGGGSPCGFTELMDLVNRVIKFVLFDLTVPIAAIMFAYAGFQLVTSGGSTEKRGTAKKVFTNTVIGLVFAVAAWLIVRTVLLILGYQGGWIFDNF